MSETTGGAGWRTVAFRRAIDASSLFPPLLFYVSNWIGRMSSSGFLRGGTCFGLRHRKQGGGANVRGVVAAPQGRQVFVEAKQPVADLGMALRQHTATQILKGGRFL